MAMTAKIVGKKLHIEIDIVADPEPSASGKNIVIAKSGGNQRIEGCKYNGESVIVGLFAYIPNK